MFGIQLPASMSCSGNVKVTIKVDVTRDHRMSRDSVMM